VASAIGHETGNIASVVYGVCVQSMSKGLVSIASGLNHSKELRDLFTDLLETVSSHTHTHTRTHTYTRTRVHHTHARFNDDLTPDVKRYCILLCTAGDDGRSSAKNYNSTM